MDQKAVGQRIKKVREKRGMTQEKLAEIVGISPVHMSVIERGVKTPRLSTFVAIANALEVSADALLVDVADHISGGALDDLGLQITSLPAQDRTRILNAIRALLE